MIENELVVVKFCGFRSDDILIVTVVLFEAVEWVRVIVCDDIVNVELEYTPLMYTLTLGFTSYIYDGITITYYPFDGKKLVLTHVTL